MAAKPELNKPAMPQQDRRRTLDETFANIIAESREGQRGESQVRPGFHGETEYWMEVHSSSRPSVQRIVILLRHDGDIQVEYHILDKSGSPFEAFFMLPPGGEVDAMMRSKLT